MVMATSDRVRQLAVLLLTGAARRHSISPARAGPGTYADGPPPVTERAIDCVWW